MTPLVELIQRRDGIFRFESLIRNMAGSRLQVLCNTSHPSRRIASIIGQFSRHDNRRWPCFPAGGSSLVFGARPTSQPLLPGIDHAVSMPDMRKLAHHVDYPLISYGLGNGFRGTSVCSSYTECRLTKSTTIHDGAQLMSHCRNAMTREKYPSTVGISTPPGIQNNSATTPGRFPNTKMTEIWRSAARSLLYRSS